MARARIKLKQLRKILEYSVERGLSLRQVAPLTGTSKTTTNEYIRRFHKTGIRYAACQELSDSELLQLFEEKR